MAVAWPDVLVPANGERQAAESLREQLRPMIERAKYLRKQPGVTTARQAALSDAQKKLEAAYQTL